MPLLIRIGMVVSLFFGVLCLVAAADVAVSTLGLLLGVSVPAERPVPPSWGTTMASSFPAMTALGALALGIAWGFFRERTWARHLVMVYWVVWCAAAYWASAEMEDPSRGLLRVVNYIPFVALSFFYFYMAPWIQEYYRRLRLREA